MQELVSGTRTVKDQMQTWIAANLDDANLGTALELNDFIEATLKLCVPHRFCSCLAHFRDAAINSGSLEAAAAPQCVSTRKARRATFLDRPPMTLVVAAPGPTLARPMIAPQTTFV